MTFPFNELEPLGLKHIREALHHQGAERGPDTIKAFGYWDYTLPYAALADDCKLRTEYTKATPHDTGLMLKKPYEAEGMRVLVYLAPVPHCSNATPVITNSYADVAAARPLLLPPAWFANDSFTAHIRPEHVRQTSQLFADQIAQQLGPFADNQ